MTTKAANIIALRNLGWPYARIAVKVGCCVGYVSAALQRHRAKGQRPCDRAWTLSERGRAWNRDRYAAQVGRPIRTYRRREQGAQA